MVVYSSHLTKIFKNCFKLVFLTILSFVTLVNLVACGARERSTEVYADKPVFAKTKFGHINNEDIVWFVISEEENSYILMSEQLIDTLPYDTSGENNEWQKTSLYEYLNTDFVNTYFTKEERDSLGFINDTNSDIVTIPTLENIEFLYGEMFYLANGFYNDKSYFEANEGMVASPTKLAVDNGIEVFDNNVYATIMQVDVDKRYDFATNCSAYWVIDRNDNNGDCYYITATGYVSTTKPNTNYIGVRPIIRVMKG